MIAAGQIRDHLIERLSPIFGMPKNAEGLSENLAKHAHNGVAVEALHELADRIIATRKTKGFPSASELIDAVKAIPAAAGARDRSGPQDDGTIRFDGAAPVTWVPSDDPRWAELVAMGRKANPTARISATTSKYAPGIGWYFPTVNVDALPLTDVERQALKALRNPQGVVERVAKDMRAFQRRLHAEAAPDAPVVPPGEGPHARALREAVAAQAIVGVDFGKDGPTFATGTEG